ncbi:MAG: polysaccharide deacetylase family protein [Armatimonadetes bacterium]|nr:polysaccharide deacetylase family protein [Armatimonadota bacterium]
MKNLPGRIALCVLLCIASATANAADYLESLREAVSAIEMGACDQAGSAIEQAIAANEADPLVHLSLAVLYLHGGRIDGSSGEFRAVTESSPGEWLAHYGLAVTALVRGDAPAVDKEIAAAREAGAPPSDIDTFERYRDHIVGRSTPARQSESLLDKQMDAYAALRTGLHADARTLLTEILASPCLPGFEERRSPVATFISSAPVALPSCRMTWTPPRGDDAREVAETVYLTADTSGADGVEFVTFYVDGTFVGMSNSEPLSFNWNTRRHTNGLHQVRIDGKNASGDVVSSKSVWVRVNNADPVRLPPVSGPEVENLRARLWRCIRLSESRRLAHYELAQLMLDEGEKDSAALNLECTLAYRPDFADARRMLQEINGKPPASREIRSGPTGRKLVALTFDDGPNQRTVRLLETLERLKIPATFFLVGFRAEAQPQLVKAIEAGGHEIGSHSYTHPNLTSLSLYEIEEQLCKTNAVIRVITGKSPRLFRPPGGNFNSTVREAVSRQGMNSVFWTVNCGHLEGGDPQGLAGYVFQNITDGGIVLMHNGEATASYALPVIAKRLRDAGYEFVTVSQLLGAR